jgi:RHS repeat-associated protein
VRDRRAKPALERFRSPPLPARCSSKKQIHPFGGPYLVDGELAHAAKFTGKDLDEDTGLYYFNARWYDSEVGRFVEEDPRIDPNNFLNLYDYCANNPLVLTDPTEEKAIMEAHGLNSSNKMWKKFNKGLKKHDDIITGGSIDIKEIDDLANNFGFENEGLFADDEWNEIQNYLANGHATVYRKQDVLKEYVRNKIIEFDKQGMDVTIAVNFVNNQGDFREQGAELYKAINFVSPHNSVDVVGHSMGALAIASYISGISGVRYEHNIDKFVAIGAPFKGSIWANVANLLGPILPFAFHERGPAYECLSVNSAAIKELQSAWNSNYQSFGVQAYSLIPIFGDTIVSPWSAWSLQGVTKVAMPFFKRLTFPYVPFGPFVVHTAESKAGAIRRSVTSILENGSPSWYWWTNYAN